MTDSHRFIAETEHKIWRTVPSYAKWLREALRKRKSREQSVNLDPLFEEVIIAAQEVLEQV